MDEMPKLPMIPPQPPEMLRQWCDRVNAHVRSTVIPKLVELRKQFSDFAKGLEMIALHEGKLHAIDREALANFIQDLRKELMEVVAAIPELNNNFLARTLLSDRFHDAGHSLFANGSVGAFCSRIDNAVVSGGPAPVLQLLPLDEQKLLIQPNELEPKQEDVAIEIRTAIAVIEKEQEPRLRQKNITIKVSVPDRPLVVEHYPAMTMSAIKELIQNAIDAMESAGGEVSVRAVLEGDEVVIRIVDEGSGIVPGREQWILDSGNTMKKGGTGMGLALVKAYVEKILHGKFSIANNPDGGATATMRITLAKEQQL